ncbi:UvrD-helicase domain-containing protein [Actinosynnema sp. NPDC047251]|uniref:DNA 3'-5' helicase n=1 Tax=Saccharothrix espanaensis (strain ATCC 51144 / DSM 44229 / JCM 9112 / NBRC 15066 / NRRL 15764) TaxID=1179773 RepID=K0JNY9_SACES|nr:UvrD-helicase domain-containing protein [Saccharothrix espanaensis]CCH28015.1 UvrD/REP helicase [Saccharothrix espanaensis DSM 44229]
MRFVADLHIHSKYSRACSRDCDLEHLTWWARRKGISLVGTGDFTHPAWHDHLRDNLEPAEPGLFRLRADLDREIDRTLAPSLAGTTVRFMLSVEISTIYKRGDRTRKVHHLVYLPDLDSAAEFNRRMARIGNIGSDGRPILGLDSRDLLEITLECGGYLVPAHIWTPWFAVLGSKSGFDAISDCYVDLADHIFAVETGLSSDPEMNWRVSGLDKYRLVSNSDAHSPPMLGREATVFDTDLDYHSVKRALETGAGFAGSIEFFPEEGKYHVDGHRKCGVRMDPAETLAHKGICPECGKPLTIGVLSRVDELADRPEGFRPPGAAGFRNLVPLPEIMSEILGTGPKSKRVLGEVDKLTAALGPELGILQDVPVDDLAAHSTLLGEAVERLRRGQVVRDAGYDGEYGVIRLFEPGELDRRRASLSLFDVEAAPATRTPATRTPATQAPATQAPATPARSAPRATPVQPAPDVPTPDKSTVDGKSLLDGLDPEQRAAASADGGPLLIIAGPGTGKTRTLTHRIAHLVTERGVAPEECLAITFTRRAAEEMAERLAALAPGHARRLTVATFHSLGVRILREHHAAAGLSAGFGIADPDRQREVARSVAGGDEEARRLVAEGDEQYKKALRALDLVDFDDLIALPLSLLDNDPALVAAYRERYRWISVDEYQDVDEQQYRLLRLLAPADGNLTAIGDPDQAIYRFRGADVGFFLRFQEDFPGARSVQLTRNYRSSALVVAGAMQVIAPTSLVPQRELRAMGEHGDARIGVHHASSEQAEAVFVARTVEQVLGGASFHAFDSGRVSVSEGSQGLGFSDFAVLYRTDRQSRALVDALTQSGLPFQKRSHDRLAERPGVARIVREIAFTAGDSVLDRVRAAAGDDHTAYELLKPLAVECGSDFERFGTTLALGVEVDTWDPRADRISLLTLHASKGLEFAVVFIVGCEDGLLPLRWPGATADDAEDVAEERRLMFVGMTRAQRHLFLSYAGERARSPFLAELTGFERVGDLRPRRRKGGTQLSLL